jgi:DNA-binding response OmpR family regulator
MATIVLVEDDDDLRDMLASLLMLEGHEIRLARDGVEGLQALDERIPQLVITDVEMPRLDGRAMVYRMFVENLGRENVPVIILSARQDASGVAAAVGTPYFLTKPFSAAALRATVERALGEALPPRPPGLRG